MKGRLLSEEHVSEVVAILHKLGCLFEVVTVNSACHGSDDIAIHRARQAEHITKHLAAKHHETSVREVWELRKQLEAMPLQLYVQSCAMSELVYNVINHASIYYAFRICERAGRISLGYRCQGSRQSYRMGERVV